MTGKSSPTFDEPCPDTPSAGQVPRQAVGIVSTSRTGLEEVGGLLAREGVGVSLSIGVEAQDLDHASGGQGMLDGLKSLQVDKDTEAIVLVAGLVSPEAAQRVLAQVRSSDKPTVICFVGVDRHLAWRSGGIPASRMDEASMRAAAWVRGWDQALISSRLEDLDDELHSRASGLVARIGPGRHRLVGLFTSGLFCHEALQMLAECASPVPDADIRDLGAEGTLGDQIDLLQHALASPEVALVLLDLPFDTKLASRLGSTLAKLPPDGQEQTLVVAHVCGLLGPAEADFDRLKALEGNLREAGVVLTASNAAAARLAAMVMSAT